MSPSTASSRNDPTQLSISSTFPKSKQIQFRHRLRELIKFLKTHLQKVSALKIRLEILKFSRISQSRKHQLESEDKKELLDIQSKLDLKHHQQKLDHQS